MQFCHALGYHEHTSQPYTNSGPQTQSIPHVIILIIPKHYRMQARSSPSELWADPLRLFSPSLASTSSPISCHTSEGWRSRPRSVYKMWQRPLSRQPLATFPNSTYMNRYGPCVRCGSCCFFPTNSYLHTYNDPHTSIVRHHAGT